jgi:hypothetical protein
VGHCPYEIVARAGICGPTHNPLQVHPQQKNLTWHANI